MPVKTVSDALALWGNILCEQLSLLDWPKVQREKYPFYKELITPSVFVQPNPQAFQNLVHFLFSVLDSSEASEKFLGLWPLHPGDKRAESQFRSAVFKWLAALQKGEWAPVAKKLNSTPSKHEMESAAEVKRLGPVLLDVRLNSSHFVSPVGEVPTALLAKFAHLVVSVASVRKHGEQTLELTPPTAEKPKRRKNRRKKIKGLLAAREAEVGEDHLMVALSKSSDETIYFDRVGHHASEAFSAYHQADAQTQAQIARLAEANRALIVDVSDSSLPESIQKLRPEIESMRSFNREFLAKPDLEGMMSSHDVKLDLGSDELFNASSNVAIPKIEGLRNKMIEGAIEVDDALAVSEEGWKMFRSHAEKQSFDTSQLQEIRCLSDKSCESVNLICPVLKEINQESRTNVTFMSKFIQDHKSYPIKSTIDEHPPHSAQSSCSTSLRVPTVETLSTKLFLPLSERRRLLAARYSERSDRNNKSNVTNASREIITMETRLSDKFNPMSLHSSTTSAHSHSSYGARLGPSIRGLQLSEDHRVEQENESLSPETRDQSELTNDYSPEGKENLTQSHLSKSGVDSIFSPLVCSRVKSVENSSFARDFSNASHPACAALSDADPGLNEASVDNASAVESSFASASALRSFVSATSYVSAHSMALPGTPPFATQVPGNGLPNARRWSSLGAKDEDGLAELSMSNFDDSDAFLSESGNGLTPS